MSPSEAFLSNAGSALITEFLKSQLQDAARRRQLLDEIAQGMPRKTQKAVGEWLLQPGVVPALISEDDRVRGAAALYLNDVFSDRGVDQPDHVDAIVSAAARAMLDRLPAAPEVRALRDELRTHQAELLAVLARPLRFRDVVYASCLDVDGMPVTVSPQLELTAFGVETVGVNPAGIEGEPAYLDYVPRDDDEKLRQAMQQAVSERTLLLVIGESAAGKSRSTAEAVRDCLDGRVLVHPRPGRLRDVLDLTLDGKLGAVVWLDDAQQYADATLGETMRLLLDAGHAVIGTIRRAELELLSPVGDVRNPAGEALNAPALVRQQSWSMEWTAEERSRVATYVRDEATKEAVARGIPLGAWCVAGPQLLARLEQARLNEAYPARFALVESVLAWYRTGIGRPIPRQLATEHAQRMLNGRCGPDDFSDASDWACESVIGRGQLARHALLQSDDAGEALAVHDYVLNHDQRRPGRTVSDSMWASALGHAVTTDEQWSIGVSAASCGQFDAALLAFGPLAAEGDAAALFNMGVMLGELGRGVDAVAAYEQLVARYGDDPAAELRATAGGGLVNMGVRLAALGRGEDAVAAFEQVVARFGDDPAAELRATVASGLANLGVALGELGRGEDAVAAYEQVVARFGDDPEAELRERVASGLVNLGVMLGVLGRGEDAVAAYEQVVARFGDDPAAELRVQVAKALVNLGVMLGELGRGEDAVAAYEQVVARFGDDPAVELRVQVAKALVNLGVMLGVLGRGEDAVTAYEQVVARFGDDPAAELRVQVAKALFNMAVTLGVLGRGEDAVAAYEQVVARFGDDPAAELRVTVATGLANLGVRLGVLGRGEDAVAAYEQLVARFGDDPAAELRERVASALFNMGVALAELGRGEDAVAAYEQVVARFGDDPAAELRERVASALVNLGVMLGVLGRGEDAVAAYEQVVARFGDDPAAELRATVASGLANLGVRLGVLGRGEDAVAAYEQVVARYGDDPDPALREVVAKAKRLRDDQS